MATPRLIDVYGTYVFQSRVRKLVFQSASELNFLFLHFDAFWSQTRIIITSLKLNYFASHLCFPIFSHLAKGRSSVNIFESPFSRLAKKTSHQRESKRISLKRFTHSFTIVPPYPSTNVVILRKWLHDSCKLFDQRQKLSTTSRIVCHRLLPAV